MTQLIPEVMRFKEVSKRFERNVLNNDSKLLYEPEWEDEWEDKEVVQ